VRTGVEYSKPALTVNTKCSRGASTAGEVKVSGGGQMRIIDIIRTQQSTIKTHLEDT